MFLARLKLFMVGEREGGGGARQGGRGEGYEGVREVEGRTVFLTDCWS